MDIKKLGNSALIFTINRLIEVVGILIFFSGILLFLSLISYSPTDPNFIFPESTEIKNILGFQGSYTADLFFQSSGLIAYLVPITFIFTGINIFRKKEIFLVIENTFFATLYSLVGSLFFGFYYENSFSFYINGNGGFIGLYLNETFLTNIFSSYENIFYYLFLLLIAILFLKSLNFSLRGSLIFLKDTYQFLFKKNKKNYTNENEIISEYIPQDEIKNLIQEDLPFIKNSSDSFPKKTKFIIPSIDLLKIPTKKERLDLDKNENNNPEFLEKILLDFGVNGSIKKVSHGPVVTLNEFEPAAGIKVSKIINLADDIARNTSSESARISTIPGSNTIGIELPNLSRENVYLSEILNNSDFKKKKSNYLSRLEKIFQEYL